MAMNVFARNRYVAYKTAAKKTGVDYEVVKAAFNSKEPIEDENVKKAVNIAHAVLRGYGEAYKKAAGAEAAPAEEAVAEA